MRLAFHYAVVESVSQREVGRNVRPTFGTRAKALSAKLEARVLNHTLKHKPAGERFGSRPKCRAYIPANLSLRNRLDHRAMKRESHSSLRMIESRDSPSSSIRISFALRLSADRIVRLRVAANSCDRSDSVRLIFPMYRI